MSTEKKITQKALKEYVHDREMQISAKAVSLIIKNVKTGEALKIVDLAGKIAQDNRRKTIKDSDVQTILDAIDYARSS